MTLSCGRDISFIRLINKKNKGRILPLFFYANYAILIIYCMIKISALGNLRGKATSLSGPASPVKINSNEP